MLIGECIRLLMEVRGVSQTRMSSLVLHNFGLEWNQNSVSKKLRAKGLTVLSAFYMLDSMGYELIVRERGVTYRPDEIIINDTRDFGEVERRVQGQRKPKKYVPQFSVEDIKQAANGKLYLSKGELTSILGWSKNTVNKYFSELFRQETDSKASVVEVCAVLNDISAKGGIDEKEVEKEEK